MVYYSKKRKIKILTFYYFETINVTIIVVVNKNRVKPKHINNMLHKQ